MCGVDRGPSLQTNKVTFGCVSWFHQQLTDAAQPLETLREMIQMNFVCVLTAVRCFTNHIQVFLIKATKDEEQVSTQLAEQLLRTHVLCKPFDHVTLRQEVSLTKQVLETTNHIIKTSVIHQYILLEGHSAHNHWLAVLVRVLASLALALTQMRNSGRTDSLVMGLPVNATVATGAKPKNSLILPASSGSVENAMNAGK